MEKILGQPFLVMSNMTIVREQFIRVQTVLDNFCESCKFCPKYLRCCWKYGFFKKGFSSNGKLFKVTFFRIIEIRKP